MLTFWQSSPNDKNKNNYHLSKGFENFPSVILLNHHSHLGEKYH